ncbi:MAG TPA: lysozyme inhibitor LprI family protein [Chthoniobacterales bacterium]|jgi:uncharacterized protein YecT (DUF1311 family)
MKPLLLLTILLATLASGFSQTQREMNEDAQKDFQKADAQLNKVYKQVLATADPESQEKLRVAQRNWIAFRDAEAAFEADREARGGSIAPLIYSGTQTALTKERTAALKALLEPSE